MIGLACGIQVNQAENLTKEDFAHCVQIVMTHDYELSHQDRSALIDELLNYAMNVDVNFDSLSSDAQEIVNKVNGRI